ncbi:MAG: lipopolysaccharide biosynthesis protein [Rubrivivax sp.]|nr:lipopolysaccharide biosynthesis protein [Rubrivivax sp.]
MAGSWRLLLLIPVVAGLLALGITFLVSPIFTARTTILPPASQQSASAGALAALGGLGVLAGSAMGVRSPTDQLVALLQSETIVDRMIDQFGLVALYEKKLRIDTRQMLRERTRVSAGKKDGLIVVEVEDTDPKRAADMANRYVQELRRLTSTLAVTEAQQRRAFFQTHLEKTRDELANAQRALQASGFNAGALRAEPRAAAEEYARVKAEATTAEVRLQALKSRLMPDTPEVQQAQSALTALRARLAQIERASETPASGDYIGRFREFKYQETLYEMFARQYELARVDESREGALIQVVDQAAPPERKSSPKRALITALTTVVAAVLGLFFVYTGHWLRLSRAANPQAEQTLQRISRALRRR